MSSQFFKTKYNLIRNRSFLSHDISRGGNAEKVLIDLYRGMEHISINGEKLKNIFIREFEIQAHNKTTEAIDEEILTFLPTDDSSGEKPFGRILTLYKKIFFKDIQDEVIKDNLARQLSTITYQKGIFFILGNSLTEDTAISDQGFFPQTQATISINTSDNGFYIDETCEVTAINDSNLPAPDDQPMYVHTNPDNSPMMTLKNRFHLCVDDNTLKYAHTDLTIEYNSDLCEKLFDKRGILEKIKDYFKSLFNMNDIEELTIVRSTNNFQM